MSKLKSKVLQSTNEFTVGAVSNMVLPEPKKLSSVETKAKILEMKKKSAMARTVGRRRRDLGR